MSMNPYTEWYSIHVPAGLPECIARAAYERNMTPGEFLAHAVQQSLQRPVQRAARSTAAEPFQIEQSSNTSQKARRIAFVLTSLRSASGSQ